MQPNEVVEIVEVTTRKVFELAAPLLQHRGRSFTEELDVLLLEAARL